MENMTLDKLARMVANGFEATGKAFADVRSRMVTRDDLEAFRTDLRSDMDALLDGHLGTYMQRYDELAHRVKRLEEQIGIDR